LAETIAHKGEIVNKNCIRMKALSVEFMGAAVSPGQKKPGLAHPEIAFAGRSNVGKSSLINCLLNRKIARISSTPGRTRQLNFFLVNRQWVFVDLPGYGYAKVPKEMQASWGKLVEGYLIRSQNLKGAVVIVDIRRGAEREDLALLEFLSYYHRPTLVVATKIDKLPRSQRLKQAETIRSQLQGYPLMLFSALDGNGRDDLWRAILALAKGRELKESHP
jgi:GTP-binding protein